MIISSFAADWKKLWVLKNVLTPYITCFHWQPVLCLPTISGITGPCQGKRIHGVMSRCLDKKDEQMHMVAVACRMSTT
jgi:hypothetical protein